MKTAVLAVISLVLFACAEATPVEEGLPGGGPDAAVDSPDAELPPPGAPDANPQPPPPTPDAAPLPSPVDAAPPPPPPPPTIDAGGGGGPFCASNADCPAADDCCFIAVCVLGTELGDLCFPAE